MSNEALRYGISPIPDLIHDIRMQKAWEQYWAEWRELLRKMDQSPRYPAPTLPARASEAGADG